MNHNNSPSSGPSSGLGDRSCRTIGTVHQTPKPGSEPPSAERLGASASAENGVVGFKTAAQAVHEELKASADKASGGGKAVLEATALMAKDTMLLKSATKLINPGTSAEHAIDAGASVAEMLHNLGGHMAEHATPTSAPGSWPNCAAFPHRAFPFRTPPSSWCRGPCPG